MIDASKDFLGQYSSTASMPHLSHDLRRNSAATRNDHFEDKQILCERPPLTFAVSTNRLDRFCTLIEANAAVLSPQDYYICVVDSASPLSTDTARRLEACGVTVKQNTRCLGLATSRNRLIELCPTRFMVCLDDDAALSLEVVQAVREVFREGYDIVGIRLMAPPELRVERAYISPSQFHYLGLHRSDRPASTWGACMGFDLELVRRTGVCFQADLGRRGDALQSGDDTTFVRQLQDMGAKLRVIEAISVIHHVAQERLKLSCMLRRAVWQGRCEVRRHALAAGLQKEISRNFDGASQSFQRTVLALLYSGAVLLGALTEAVMGFGNRA